MTIKNREQRVRTIEQKLNIDAHKKNRWRERKEVISLCRPMFSPARETHRLAASIGRKKGVFGKRSFRAFHAPRRSEIMGGMSEAVGVCIHPNAPKMHHDEICIFTLSIHVDVGLWSFNTPSSPRRTLFWISAISNCQYSTVSRMRPTRLTPLLKTNCCHQRSVLTFDFSLAPIKESDDGEPRVKEPV